MYQSTQGINIVDLQNCKQMSRTNGSQGSFAYTSNKHAPKYSPARNQKPGAQNIPMSYSGPPTQQEMSRNQSRHHSGNRNFASNQEPPKNYAAEPVRFTKEQKPGKKSKKKAGHRQPGQAQPAPSRLFEQQ